MGTSHPTRLRRPAYAKLLEQAVGKPALDIMVEVHMGRSAWQRVKRTPVDVLGFETEDPRRVNGHTLAGTWWGRSGFPMVVALDTDTTVSHYDFSCLDRLCVILDARDCSLEPAQECARRMCEHGAHTVCLMHPQVSAGGGFSGWDIYRGAPRP